MSIIINEINTYFGRCRCCLDCGYWKNMWEEHYWEGEKEIYVDMLKQCFGLSWEPEVLPKEHDQICESCVLKLREANKFKKTVLESQLKLIEHLDEAPSTSIKTEPVIIINCKEEPDSLNTADNSFIDDPHNSLCDNPDDPDYMDDSQEMDFEEVEFLEEDDDKQTKSKPKPVQRRMKGTVPPSNTKWPKKLPKAERYKTYKQYSEEDLKACIEAVRKEGITITEASERFNIPRKTVSAKINDDQNGITTMEKDNPASKKTSKKIKTIFREKQKNIKIVTSKIKNKAEKNDIIKKNNELSRPKLNITDLNGSIENIKIENIGNDKMDVKQVRLKYKAIANEKIKKDLIIPKNNDETEMNKHKNNIKHILECSNATMIKGFWGNGYSCCFCNVQKENPRDLKTHNIETHSDIGKNAVKGKYVSDLVIRLDVTDLKCNICSKNINNIEDLTEHIMKEHNKKIYKDIKSYVIPFKFESDILKCVKCYKEFKYFKLLSEHMSEHYRNFQCSVCERFFINKQSMQTHSYRHKSGVFKCSHCPKVFDTRPKKSVHERVTHTLLNKTRKCNFCNERFSTKDLVQSHETKVHGAKIPVFNCQACNKSYNSQSSLLTHRKRFHLMLRPHKCSYCDMAFYSRIELRSHIVTHTKSRDFKCDICEKSFGTRCSLNQHLRGHLDDRRFKCDICERTFVHRTAFKVHMRNKHGKVV